MALLSDIMQVFPIVIPPIQLATENAIGGVKSRKSGVETDLGAITVDKTPVTGSNPTSLIAAKFIAGETDGKAFIYAYISYTNAGAFVTSLSVPLPASAPAPWQFENWPVDSWIYLGSGGLFTARNALANSSAQAGIYKEANGSLSLKFVPGPAAIAGKFAFGYIPYQANS